MSDPGRGLGLALVGLGLLALATTGVFVVTMVGEDDPELAHDGGTGSAPALASLDSYLDSIIEPLRQAALDHGHDPEEFLPTEEEEAAALASGSLESAETRRVLDKLRESYVFFKMRFPGSAAGDDSAGESDRISGTDPSNALRPYFELRRDTLEALAVDRGEDPELWLPSMAEVDRAAETGHLGSPEASRVLNTLRDGYFHFGETFPEPLILD